MMPSRCEDAESGKDLPARECLRRRIVRLKIPPGSEEILLEMPGDQPLGKWMGKLIRTLALPEPETSPPVRYAIKTEDGRRIPDVCSLNQAGIKNSDLLLIVKEDPLGGDCANAAAPELSAVPDAFPPADEARREILPLECASLLHGSGVILELDPAPAVIGRASRGARPDIDLSPWDPRFAISRKHAVIDNEGEAYVLRPERTTNGTFVNGVEIPAGSKRTLSDGDRLQFGFGGEEFIFRLPRR